MRKITEKISIIAQVCITLIFVATTILYITGIIPYNDGIIDNGVFVTLLIILAITYGLLSAYIIYVNFSENENINQILLFCDSESATHANSKVVRNIVKSCAKKVNGLRVRRVKMRVDEKQGLVITIKVNASTSEVSNAIDKMRCLVTDSFKNTLNLTFSSINFVIARLKTRYKPNVERAEKLAKTLTEQRELSAEIYDQPFQDNCKECKNNDGEDESAESAHDEVADKEKATDDDNATADEKGDDTETN